MKPRRIAADNLQERITALTAEDASMKPRRIAADNFRRFGLIRASQTASMKPRRIAADNATGLKLDALLDRLQ